MSAKRYRAVFDTLCSPEQLDCQPIQRLIENEPVVFIVVVVVVVVSVCVVVVVCVIV